MTLRQLESKRWEEVGEMAAMYDTLKGEADFLAPENKESFDFFSGRWANVIALSTGCDIEPSEKRISVEKMPS